MGSTAYIRATDLDGGRVNFDTAARISDTALKRITKGIGRSADIIFSHKGTVGKLARAPSAAPPFVCSPQTTFWRVLNPGSLDLGYLYAFMQSSLFSNQWMARKGETDMADYVSLTAQRELWVAIPPIEQQKAIGSLFGAIEDKLALNHRMNLRLEELAASVYRSWFVDFDPVVANAALRVPLGMDLQTAALFPSSFADSELGPIPLGWRVGNIYEASDVEYGAPFSASKFNLDGEGRLLIRIRDLSDHLPAIWTSELHPKGFLVSAGDIIVGMDGEFRAHVWRGPEAWLNQRLCRFVPRMPYGRAFTYLCVKQPLADVERSEVGTTVIHLGKADIDRFRVLFAGDEIHGAFNERVDPLIALTVQNGSESRTLTELRDLLLPKLLLGEIRIREAERAVRAIA
jgi:type I restriction enzyme S subunit